MASGNVQADERVRARVAGVAVQSVHIVIVAPSDFAARLRQVLEEGLGTERTSPTTFELRESLKLDEVLGPAPSKNATARIYIDASQLSSVGLVLVSLDGNRYILRTLPSPEGTTAVFAEQLVLVVSSGLDALEGNAPLVAVLDRSHAAPAVTKVLTTIRSAPLKASSDKKSITGALGLIYAFERFASAVPLRQAVGVRGSIGSLQWPAAAAVVAEADYVFSESFARQGVGAELHAWRGRLGVRTQLLRRGRTQYWAAVSSGAEWLYIQPQSSDGSVDVQPPAWLVAATARVGLGFSLSLFRPFATIGISVFGEADLSSRHLDVDRAGTLSTELRPDRVRPGIMLTLF